MRDVAVLARTLGTGGRGIDVNENLTRRIENVRRWAAAQLQTAAGRDPSGIMPRSGVLHLGEKYIEGAVAALTELHRATWDCPPGEPPTEALGLAGRWRDRMAAAPSPSWVAFYEGGVDALTHVLSDLESH